MLAFSSKPSHAEAFYRAMVSSIGNQPGSSEALGTISTAPGTRMDGWCYANAMAFARARYQLERAGNQVLPTLLTELLATREREYGVIPSPMDTDDTRRAAVAAAYLLPRGAAVNEVRALLEALLGDDFIKYRPTPKAEAVIHPAALGDQPQNLQTPSVARRVITLTEAVTTGLGAPQYVRYQRLVRRPETEVPAHADFHELRVGDVLVIDPGDLSLAERATVTGLSYEFDDFETGPFYPTVELDLSNPHATGTVGTTAPWPYWRSTKRHNLVVLSPTAALDAEKRRKTNTILGKVLRGVSTWNLAGESSAGSFTTGPFTVSGGMLGVTTIGLINL